jgi:hypothetical protein
MGRRSRKKFYDNNVDALIPEFWANESLAILEENMVMGNLVHRDFSPQVANFGDIVNTRRPSEFTAKRKWATDDVTVQDATLTNVQVKLDQHVHVSFLLRDGELALAMKDLVSLFIQPAMLAEARFVDKVLYGQYAQFLGNSVGLIGGYTGDNVKNYILDTRERLNTNKAYMDGRNFVLTTKTESATLKPEFFTSAEKVGDAGSALRKASLGETLGFNFFMSQNGASVVGAFTSRTFQINNGAGYAAGATALTVDTGTGEITVGSWVKIDGIPYQVTARTGTAPTTAITLERGLLRPVADNLPVVVYTPGAVNLLAGYAAGWYKAIAFDGFSGATPKVGQTVTFGTSTTVRYTIVDVTSTEMILDRPLEASIANDDAINIAPDGEYNFAFHRNALTMVNRPLPVPMGMTGVRAAVVNYNGLSVRVCITYDGNKQGHLVTLDFLFGVKVLDTNLGAVMVA